jgi:serine/threonine protein phosphatase PrpC
MDWTNLCRRGYGSHNEEKTLKWEAAVATRIGGRKEQQDRLGAFSAQDGLCWLLVVADGMGGHQGGSLASQTLIEVAEHSWKSTNGHPDDPEQFLEDLCQEANREIHQKGIQQDLDPHTTVVAVLISGARAFWVHVGDSRFYLFRNQTLLERTKDHSLLQILVDAGEVDEKDMGSHPDQNKLLRSIGENTPARTRHGKADLQPEDRMLLCSDGFWEKISVDEMAELLAAENLQSAVNRYAEIASERGGPRGDNIAVVVARAPSISVPPGQKPRRSILRSIRGRMAIVLATLVLLPVLGILAWKVANPDRTDPLSGPSTPTEAPTEARTAARTEAVVESWENGPDASRRLRSERDPGESATDFAGDPLIDPAEADTPGDTQNVSGSGE